MPIYEFDCKTCQKPFEELVLSASRIDKVTCPTCGSADVKKKMSTFASKIAGGGSSLSFGSSQASSCGTSGGT